MRIYDDQFARCTHLRPAWFAEFDRPRREAVLASASPAAAALAPGHRGPVEGVLDQVRALVGA